MSVILQREIANLHNRLMSLCAEVEKSVIMAVRAIEEINKDMAETVITADSKIDLQEVEIEEEALKILALHQPVAIDLRMILATIKMNNDLERISDYACHICRRAIEMFDMGSAPQSFGLSSMSTLVVNQLKRSLDALVDLDLNLADEVIRGDRQVDAIQRKIISAAENEALENPTKIRQMIRVISVTRALERIGDHTVNIAEDVIYMVSGNIIRHSAVRSVADGEN